MIFLLWRVLFWTFDCCCWYEDGSMDVSGHKTWPSSDMVIVNGSNPYWCRWWKWHWWQNLIKSSYIDMCVMSETDLKVLDFLTTDIIQLMVLCLGCLAIGSLEMLSCPNGVVIGLFGLVQGANVHSFIFLSLDPCRNTYCWSRHNLVVSYSTLHPASQIFDGYDWWMCKVSYNMGNLCSYMELWYVAYPGCKCWWKQLCNHQERCDIQWICWWLMTAC